MVDAHFEYILRLADDSLILGQRLSEWCGHAPLLEEDLALANVVLDLIGQARLLLTHAGNIEGRARDEDRLAFLRAEHEYRNCTLVELPNQDFAVTVTKNLLFCTYRLHLWQALQQSKDAELAAIAEKSLKETRYHVQHAGDWVVRLGDGTSESHARTQAALDHLWPYTTELFATDLVEEEAHARGIGATGASLQATWEASVLPVFEEATLAVPVRTPFRSCGRHGAHSEHMGHLLAQMQYMQRAYPGMQW